MAAICDQVHGIVHILLLYRVHTQCTHGCNRNLWLATQLIEWGVCPDQHCICISGGTKIGPKYSEHSKNMKMLVKLSLLSHILNGFQKCCLMYRANAALFVQRKEISWRFNPASGHHPLWNQPIEAHNELSADTAAGMGI